MPEGDQHGGGTYQIPRYEFRAEQKLLAAVALMLFYGQAQILIAVGSGSVDATFFQIGTIAALLYGLKSEVFLGIWYATLRIVSLGDVGGVDS